MTSIGDEKNALRAELYAARRSVGSLEQSLSKVTEERDGLAQKLQHLQSLDCTGEVQQLQAALKAESDARKSAEEVLQKITLERQRLQRARDELATNLLAAQQRAQEAEEDLQRAEEQTAAATAELRILQTRLSGDRAERARDSQNDAANNEMSQDLEVERSRNAVLAAALSSAKAEREHAQAEAAAARQRVQQLEQQLQYANCAGPPPPRLPDPSVTSNGPLSVAQPAPSQDGATDPEALVKQIATFRRQVLQLKTSRDKLLSELDIQFIEAERLGNENSALSQALQEQLEAAGTWERQAQEACAQLERLKDLLEESAQWRREPPTPPSRAEPGEDGVPTTGEQETATEGDKGQADKQYVQAHILDLEQRLMQESARSAALDLQVRALCAELHRAAHATAGLGRSVLPALNGIESRISQALSAGR
ncbi:g3774 [Coccomyxa elongata]